MDAQTYELKTILTLERRFVIPTFQRDYEWTEDGQWRLLFDDLEVVIDRLEQERNIAEMVGDPVTKADKKVAPHFLGAIVLDRVPTAAGNIDMRSVIDGQQRLTTLQLLIRGILDVLIASGSPREKQVRRLIQNPADVVHADDERHKVWPRRRDRSIWRLAMADDFPADSDHLYFKGPGILPQPPATLPERMLDAYRRVVQQSVTTALPLLVWLRTLPEDEFALEDHLRAVVRVDSWVTRRVIVGSNTRGYGKRFVDVLEAAQAAREKGESIIDVIEANLLTAGSDNLTWPTEGEVEQALLTRPFYNNLTQERIRMLLGPSIASSTWSTRRASTRSSTTTSCRLSTSSRRRGRRTGLSPSTTRRRSCSPSRSASAS